MRALVLTITIVGLLLPSELHAQRPAPVGARVVRIATGPNAVAFVPRPSAYPPRNRGTSVLKHAAIGAAIGAGIGALAGLYETLNASSCANTLAACVTPNNAVRYAAVGVGFGALIGGIAGLDTGR
jgi:hypothetical protein